MLISGLVRKTTQWLGAVRGVCCTYQCVLRTLGSYKNPTQPVTSNLRGALPGALARHHLLPPLLLAYSRLLAEAARLAGCRAGALQSRTAARAGG